MALTFADALRDALNDTIESHIGTSAIMKIRSGAAPTHVGDASTGTVLATLNLPSDWMAASSGGVKSKSGTWSDSSADASGTAAHFEITTSGGTVKIRGSVTTTGGGGDLTVDNTSFASAQAFTITQFDLTAPGA